MSIQHNTGGAPALSLTATIVAAYVGNNQVGSADLGSLIASVHAALTQVGEPIAEPVRQEPAIAIKKSVTEDYIICLEDGKKLKTLKRYLRTRYSLTPDQYRAKWNLAADYPVVAPSYAKRRSEFAKTIGLGRKAAAPPPPPPPPPAKRGRKKAVAATA